MGERNSSMTHLAKFVTTVAGAAALVSIGNGSWAQDPDQQPTELPSRYEVEIIVFRHLDQRGNTAETPAAASMIEASPFDLNLADLPVATGSTPPAQPKPGERQANVVENQNAPGERDPATSFALPPLTLEFPDFMPSDKDDFKLNRVYDRIARLDAYEPMLHVGWIQPVKGTDQARPFLVGADSNEEPVGVNGTVTLYKERYLHLALNLALELPSSVDVVPPSPEPPPERVFGTGIFVDPARNAQVVNEIHRIQESRRIRLSTTHYFDHPLFGVIATVNEIKTVTNPDDSAPDSG
jgi:hypothetical protein